jgi:hypothetical protein
MIIILYRKKACIYQTQLKDFIGKKAVEKYDMNVPKDYRVARKKFRWIPLRPNRGKNAPPTKAIVAKSQRRITDYIQWVPRLMGKYLYRFPKVKIPRFEEFGEETISKKEWDMHRYLSGFNGFLENLFEFNDFSYFDELQEKLESNGASFKDMFLKDVFAYELLRINLGFKNYAGLEKMGKFTGRPPLFSITHDPSFFPTAADMSFVLKQIPAHYIFEFFQKLAKECVDCGIIVPRILIWDGQFIKSNCKNNKEKDKSTYNDPDAGYGRHIGTKKGVGYDPGILYAFCFDRWFPVYFKMFPANRSDTTAFRETTSEFLSVSNDEWLLVIADSGPYSLNNLENLQVKGIVPLIRARKSVKNQPVKEFKKGYYFNAAFIPKEWSDEYVLKIYGFRPMIEQGNSYNNTYYNAFRMNTQGLEAAIRLRATIYILELLKALTAYKIGRPDLVMKPSAFESTRYFSFQATMPSLAESSGYLIFKEEASTRSTKFRSV